MLGRRISYLERGFRVKNEEVLHVFRPWRKPEVKSSEESGLQSVCVVMDADKTVGLGDGLKNFTERFALLEELVEAVDTVWAGNEAGE